MKKPRLAVSLVFGALLVMGPGPMAAIADEDLNQDITTPGLTPIQARLVSGFADFSLHGGGGRVHASQPTNFFPHADDGCPVELGRNVKVNQNCENLSDADLAGRAQAQNETSIAADPNNPDHLLGSFNDYRRGDANCYGAFSLDGGRSWADSTVPMSFTRGGSAPNRVGDPFNGAREYWQAGGDTSVAFDTKGNAYLSCQVFNRGPGVTTNRDQSSAFLVYRSTHNAGASWNFPGRYVRVANNVTPVGTNPFPSGVVLLDKQLMTVDNHVGSPFQDRVYVTWTEFATDGTAYIYESFSSDYAEHFSAPVLVSANSALCTLTYGVATTHGNCNENQFSQPFSGPDGNLYVTWANFNNTPVGSDNRNQMLLARSTDGGQSFSAPVKVADYYDLPDCVTYQGQDFGRACVPEKGPTTNSVFRATNYPSGAVDPTNANRVVVSLGSYINIHSNESNGCTPAGTNPATGNNLYTGVKTAGACNNDILLSVSNDGGLSFTGTTRDPRVLTSVTSAGGQAVSDQWFQWLAFSDSGKLAVSYYDRQYGDDETTGASDISLSGSDDLKEFGVARVSTRPSPAPTQFGGVFWGDYAGLTTTGHNSAYPLWSDTRDPELFTEIAGCGTVGGPPQVCEATDARTGLIANDQDSFGAAVNIPTGENRGH